MRLLLDTPIWIWSLLEPERLVERVRQALEDPATELWLSPVSVWELLQMIEDGRVAVEGEADGFVADALRAVPVREAALSHEVVRRGHARVRTGEDPARRLLEATALVYDLTFVTTETRASDAREVRVLANR